MARSGGSGVGRRRRGDGSVVVVRGGGGVRRRVQRWRLGHMIWGQMGFGRATLADVVYHPVNCMLLLGSTRITRTSGASALGVAVVAASFAGDGQPEAGWSDLQIRHLVSAASWGDRVASENGADGG